MSPSRFESFPYRRVAAAIGRALDMDSPPECVVKHGRTTLTFRRLGATRWPEERQMAFAARVVAVARPLLASDGNRGVRNAARRAVVIVYEDASLVQGCAVTARWECAVPGES